MDESPKLVDQIQFRSGIDYRSMSVLLDFGRPIPSLSLDSASAKHLGECLIKFANTLDAAIMVRNVVKGMQEETQVCGQTKTEVSSEKGDAVRTGTDHPPDDQTAGGGPDPGC